MSVRFKRGDHIEVRLHNDPHTVIRGVALDTRGFTGYSEFKMEVAGQELTLNLNKVRVELLFSADLARSMTEEEVSAY